MRSRERGMRNEQNDDSQEDRSVSRLPSWKVKEVALGERRTRNGDGSAHRLIQFAVANRFPPEISADKSRDLV
jgi:hypothetical protein